MAKLEVDCIKLNEYGQFMVDKEKEFSTLKNKMESTLAGISAWEGIDADTFKKSAAEYFENLKSIETAISSIGTQIQGINSGYVKKIQAFYDAIM